MKKFIGTMTALAFAVTGVASAQTTNSELEAQIQALMAQIAALSGTTTTTVAAPSTCNFTQTLTLGSTGAEVVELQSFLEMKGTLTIPAGVSKGYFGGLTQSALASYQAMVGISPAVGYFGPITRAQVNGSCGTTVVTTPGTVVTVPGTTTSFVSNVGDEASLEDYSMDSEDDAEEGEMTLVATVEFDVEDGDFRMERLDLTFDNAAVSGTADDEPWDVYETLHLAVDGDVFAEEDVDDEDDWNRENNPFTFRISGFDEVVEEGDTFEFEIWLTAQNNVDDADNADWEIYIGDDGIRGIDTAGITQYTGDDADTVSFGIDEEGGDEEIKIKSSNDDPSSALLRVDEDDETDHEVFVFELEAEENDIEIDELVVDVILGNVDYATAINDVTLEMGGTEVDDFDVVYYNSSAFTALDTSVASTAFARLTFDVDGDFEIDGDDEENVTVTVEFKKADLNDNGLTDGIFDTTTVKTIQVGVRSVDGDGVDDVDATSSLNGKVHTLTLTDAEITNLSWKVTESSNSANGTIDLMFTVNNSDSDEDFDVDSASILDTATAAFVDATGFASVSGEGTLSRVSGDSVSSAGTIFTVDQGDTVGFRVRYTANVAGTYEVSVTEVAGVELEDDDELSPSLIL